MKSNINFRILAVGIIVLLSLAVIVVSFTSTPTLAMTMMPGNQTNMTSGGGSGNMTNATSAGSSNMTSSSK
jgi:hypothetical protein